MKTKSLISGLAMLALVFGAQRGVTAAGDSQKKKPPAQDTYTITQLDIGENVASSGQLISDNQVVAGNLQDGSLVRLRLERADRLRRPHAGREREPCQRHELERHRHRRRRYARGTEVLGFIWTPANGLVTIGDLGGGYTVPQGVNSSGVVIGDSTPPRGVNTRSCGRRPAAWWISTRRVSTTAPDAS